MVSGFGDDSAVSAVVKAAAGAADEVDREARFPGEAVDMMRANKLLSVSLPLEVGGGGASITDLSAMARAIGAACSSAGMVFAMHHIQALSLTFHGATGQTEDLAREIASSEALLASATTEITTGGDVRSSTCAVEVDGDTVRLEKNAPVISYGANADYIFTTARRTPDSPPSDQVLVVCPARTTVLEQTSTWDTLGFRGTCSPGYMLRTETSVANILPVDYAMISAHTMLPSSHILWASVWLGMADAALAKARAQVRASARKSPGTTPLAARLADLLVVHQEFEALVSDALSRYEDFLSSDQDEPTVGFAIAMNNVKLRASTLVVEVVTGVLALIGINAYREDHKASMGRLVRDCFGPQLMVSNERIRANNAQLVPAYRG